MQTQSVSADMTCSLSQYLKYIAMFGPLSSAECHGAVLGMHCIQHMQHVWTMHNIHVNCAFCMSHRVCVVSTECYARIHGVHLR